MSISRSLIFAARAQNGSRRHGGSEMKPVRQRQEPYGTHLSGALASHWLCREYAYGKRLSTETQILNSQSAESPAFASVVQPAPEYHVCVLFHKGGAERGEESGVTCPIRVQKAQQFRISVFPGLLYCGAVASVVFEYNQSHGIHIPASQLHSAIRRTVTYHSDLDVRNRRISDDVSTSV